MIIYFHRNINSGYSINKVTQTIISGFQNKMEYYLPYSGGSFTSIVGNLLFTWKRRNNGAIIHVTGDAHYIVLALIGCKSVLTIHDTVSVDFNQNNPIKKCILKWFWYKLPLIFATKVVCISEETKKCIERYTKRRDIVVVYNAIDPVFKNVEMDLTGKPKKVLLIGTNPNKNLERTVEALKDFDCELTIIGMLSERQQKVLNNNQINYHVKTGLTDQQIVDEYVNADIVSFISLFEGFGMIIIEANRVGRPVICSNIPVLREIAGDSALFVNPFDVEDMKRGFLKLFNDSRLRSNLVANGYVNVRRFELTELRKQWINIYNSLSCK